MTVDAWLRAVAVSRWQSGRSSGRKTYLFGVSDGQQRREEARDGAEDGLVRGGGERECDGCRWHGDEYVYGGLRPREDAVVMVMSQRRKR